MSLIDTILQASRQRLEARKVSLPLVQLKERALIAPRASTSFRAALHAHAFSVIAEIKRRSPSAGEMDPKNVENALKAYDSNSAVSAISILTDEDHFGGRLEDLLEARKRTKKPLLRKDFILDEYQVWEARSHGADAVLLMAALHVSDPGRSKRLFDLATTLGMDVLFELGMAGDSSVEEQRKIIPRDALIWGVNSRRFQTSRFQAHARLGRLVGKDLSIEAQAHAALRAQIPKSKTAVAESGIHAYTDVHALADLGYRAALIGTALLKKGAVVGDAVGAFEAEINRIGTDNIGLSSARATS